MATDTPSPRFDQTDWDEVAGGSDRGVPLNLKLTLAFVVPLVALFLYDWLVLGQYDATFAAVGWGYDVSQLDWLFALSLVLFGAYGLLPLYQAPRMTRYYWNEFKRNRPAVVSLVFLIAIFLMGVFGPLFISPPEVSLFKQFQPPLGAKINMQYVVECTGRVTTTGGERFCHGTLAHPFGTTDNGQDIFTLVVYGMQITMKIAFVTTLLVITVGTAVGTVAAYAGGIVDEILMRYVDIQQSFPTFILYLLILYIYGGGIALFILLFGFFTWEGTARYVRSNALAKTEEEYIKASQLTGAGAYHIIRRHIVPNTASSIITDVTLLVPGFILAEAQLAFLGLGDTSVPSWGQVLASGRDVLPFAPWVTLVPGLFIFLTILAFNFLGDALLDALNPKAAAESE
jgi:peptide/nickel transport system permease protein